MGGKIRRKGGKFYGRTLFLWGICLCRGHIRIRNGKILTVRECSLFIPGVGTEEKRVG